MSGYWFNLLSKDFKHMGGSSSDYGQTNQQATPDPMAAMPARQQAPANQGQMFGKMDAWNVESSKPEQIAQGFNQGLQSGISLGNSMNSKKESSPKNGKNGYSGSQAVDEYGYPYSLDANGERVYEIGSRQVS